MELKAHLAQQTVTADIQKAHQEAERKRRQAEEDLRKVKEQHAQ